MTKTFTYKKSDLAHFLRRSLLLLCCLIATNISAQYYEVVKDEAGLVEGGQYIIVNTEYGMAISTTEKNAKNLPSTPVTIEGDIIRNVGDAAVFSLNVYSSAYAFYREGKGYLCATSNTSNELTYYDASMSANDYCKAKITFEADNSAVIKFIAPKTTKNWLRYNYDSDLFSCYASGQEPVSIFRYVSGDPSKLTQNLQFSHSAMIVDLGDLFVEPVLTGAMTDVVYSSSDTNVATVNPLTGKVSILNAGVTTITATAESDDTYNGASVSYTLTVKLTEELIDFTNPQSIGFTTPAQSRETKVDRDINQGVVTISVTHGATTDTRFFNGKSDGVYLGVYANGGGMTFSVPDDYYIEAIEFNPLTSSDVEGFSELKNKIWIGCEQTVTFTATKTVRVKSVKVSYKRQRIVSISSVGYSTFSSESSVILPEGVKAGVVNVEDDIAQVEYIYNPGDVIPANEGVLLKANPGTYNFSVVNSDVEKSVGVTNFLLPANTDEVIDAPSGKLLYIFANDPEDGLGFYIQSGGNNGQQVFGLKGKAYLAVDSSIQVRGFKINEKQPSNIEAVDLTEKSTYIYSIDGKRLQHGNTPKGIYIVNGKKYLRK